MTSSLLKYDLSMPTRIAFGWGRRSEAGGLAKTLGRRALIVCGSRTLERSGQFEEIEANLLAAGVASTRVTTITREPEVEDIDQAVRELQRTGVQEGDFLLAIGGGSAIDLAKAVAALATNRQSQSVRDYLEGVGRGLQIERPPLPCMAMPTTAGTGSEATKNAVISSFDPPFKKSLRSEQMMPKVVLVDPELTTSVPANVTAATGMDAITQLIESYVSRRAQPIPQALAIDGLRGVGEALRAACSDGTNREARERMSQAALLSGIALANSGLGLAHGVAAALGVHCRVTHGLACAVMLPAAMRVNRDVRLRELADVGRALTAREFASDASAADAGIEYIAQLCEQIGIPRRLSALGVTSGQIPELVPSSRGNSMSGNPRELSDEELYLLLEAML